MALGRAEQQSPICVHMSSCLYSLLYNYLAPDTAKWTDTQNYILNRFGLLTLLPMGGGVLKTRIAFDALFDPLRVKIEHRYFLKIPNYTYISI